MGVPPGDDKGKSSASLTSKQLRRKKVDMLKLCVSFAFAAKHYLRGEDGLEWQDYMGILPATVVRLAQPGPGSRKSSAWASYSATARTSASGSREDSDAEGEGESGEVEVRRDSPDATKRIRVKRSKDNMKQSGLRSPKTPLLSSTLHQTIDFHADPDNLTTPLPLV